MIKTECCILLLECVSTLVSQRCDLIPAPEFDIFNTPGQALKRSKCIKIGQFIACGGLLQISHLCVTSVKLIKCERVISKSALHIK